MKKFIAITAILLLFSTNHAFAKGGGDSYLSYIDSGNQTTAVEYAWGSDWKHQLAFYGNTTTNEVQWNPHYMFSLIGSLQFGIGPGASLSQDIATEVNTNNFYGGLSLDWALGSLHIGYESHFINGGGNSGSFKLGWAF